MQNKDNRKNKRITIQARATIENNKQSVDGLLMDFSINGLGLLLDQNEFVNVGQKVDIRLETGPKLTAVQGIIKWVRKLKEDRLFDYAVGMELTGFEIARHENLLQHAES